MARSKIIIPRGFATSKFHSLLVESPTGQIPNLGATETDVPVTIPIFSYDTVYRVSKQIINEKAARHRKYIFSGEECTCPAYSEDVAALVQ